MEALKLIIADDEPNIRNNINLLFPWGDLGIHVVFLAANGQEVLDYMEQNPVDMVLSDIRMPVLDGISLLRICKEKNKNIIFILLSAYADFQYARLGMQYGASAYLTKPVSYMQLMNTFSKFTKISTPLPSPINTSISSESYEELPEYKGYYEEIIDKIQDYVDKNVATASLVSASELTNLSPSYISTLFHRYKNQTFSEYLVKKRIDKALVLLIGGDTITNVSYIVGYNNPKSFINAFKHYLGFDPNTRFVYK